MKSIWTKICAACLVTMTLVVTWEIIAALVWNPQIADQLEKEEYELKYKAMIDSAVQGDFYREIDEKEIKQQAKQNVANRGNPYSLFR